MRKLLAGLFVVLVLGSIGLFFWARAVFTRDTFRAALAGELSKALAQPVSIGTISAAVYPRATLTLGHVVIGQPAAVQIASMRLGTDLRALLSRRIEHATVRVDGAKVRLPLPASGRAPSAPEVSVSSEETHPLVELVSIDEIVLSDVDLISAGCTLHGHFEVVPEPGGAVTLRRATMSTDDTTLEATGRITDLSGPTGELTIEAGELNIDRLLPLFNDFVASTSDAESGATTRRAKPDLTVTITATRARQAGFTLDDLSGRAHITDAGWNVTFNAARATLATLRLDAVSGRARVTDARPTVTINAARATLAGVTAENVAGTARPKDDGVLLQPLAFAVFGGRYDGSLGYQPARPGSAPLFTVAGALFGVDVVTMTRSAGAATVPITGRLSAQLELTGMGADAPAAMRNMHGTARVTIANGVARHLGLLRAIVVATSMRGAAATFGGAGAAGSAEAARSGDEPFTSLSATLAVSGRRATTRDLRFEGTDVSFVAHGSFALNGSDVNLAGQSQLSRELTAKAGTDLIRYTSQNGRVTLPITITGSATAPSVQIDISEALQRAIRNRLEEELRKAIIKGLGGVIKRP